MEDIIKTRDDHKVLLDDILDRSIRFIHQSGNQTANNLAKAASSMSGHRECVTHHLHLLSHVIVDGLA